MSKARRSFSASEKLSMISEADQFGVTQTMRKHSLSSSVFRRWKESFNEGGVSNLQSYSRQRNPEMDALEVQIRILKNIVAKQSIELEFKTELLNLPAGRQEKVNSTSSVGRGNGVVQIKTYGYQTGSSIMVRCSTQ